MTKEKFSNLVTPLIQKYGYLATKCLLDEAIKNLIKESGKMPDLDKMLKTCDKNFERVCLLLDLKRIKTN